MASGRVSQQHAASSAELRETVRDPTWARGAWRARLVAKRVEAGLHPHLDGELANDRQRVLRRGLELTTGE